MNHNSNRAFAPYLQAVEKMSQKTHNSGGMVGKGYPDSNGNVTGRAFGGGYHQSQSQANLSAFGPPG